MAKVVMSPMALSNLKSIHKYISKNAELYADKVVEKIFSRLSILETHTRIGKVVREFSNPSIRELIEGKYRIIYEIISEDEISILRIYHSSRLLKKLRPHMTKDFVTKAIKNMPEEFELDDFIERLVFMEKVEQGLNDVKEGRTITHGEMKERILSWGKT